MPVLVAVLVWVASKVPDLDLVPVMVLVSELLAITVLVVVEEEEMVIVKVWLIEAEEVTEGERLPLIVTLAMPVRVGEGVPLQMQKAPPLPAAPQLTRQHSAAQGERVAETVCVTVTVPVGEVVPATVPVAASVLVDDAVALVLALTDNVGTVFDGVQDAVALTELVGEMQMHTMFGYEPVHE